MATGCMAKALLHICYTEGLNAGELRGTRSNEEAGSTGPHVLRNEPQRTVTNPASLTTDQKVWGSNPYRRAAVLAGQARVQGLTCC